MILCTLRHGRTQYSLEKRYAGSLDISLSELGIQDAHKAKTMLAEYTFNAIISSTQKRSVETARIIAADAIPIIQSSLCVERNFGVLEGCTWDQAQNMNPPVLFVKVGKDYHSVNPSGGEALENVYARAKKFQQYLFNKHLGSHLLIVSHGIFLQMFHGILRGMSCIESLAVAYPSNLELTIFHFQGRRLFHEKILRLDDSSSAAF